MSKLTSFCLLGFVCFIVANQSVQYHQDEVTTTIRLGPHTVPPGEMFSVFQNFSEIMQLSNIHQGKLGMTGLDGRIVDTNNQPQDQDFLYLHHFFISSNAATDTYLFCPEYIGYEPIGGTGAEQTTIHLPSPYYVPIPANAAEDWGYSLHVVNPEQKEKVFYYEVELTYIVVDNSDVRVRGNFQSVLSCNPEDDDEWDVAQGGSGREYRYVDFVNTFDGVMIWATTHLHRGGLSLSLTDTDTGETYFSGRCHYDNPDHPDWITSCDYGAEPNVRFEMGQNLRLASVYDSTKAHSDVMGVLMSYNVVEKQDDATKSSQVVGGSWKGYSATTEGFSLAWMAVFSTAVVVVVVSIILIVVFVWKYPHKLIFSKEPEFVFEQRESDV